jgi:hypothetical protein
MSELLSGPVGLEAASRHAVCHLVSGDNEGETIQGETRIGQDEAADAAKARHRRVFWPLARPVPRRPYIT